MDCTACQGPASVPNSDKSACECVPGYYKYSDTTCLACDPGKISSGGTSTFCTDCATKGVGYQALTNADQSACLCSPGYRLANGTCVACTGNTITAGGNATTCTDCATLDINSEANGDHSACVCKSGYTGVSGVCTLSTPCE